MATCAGETRPEIGVADVDVADVSGADGLIDSEKVLHVEIEHLEMLLETLSTKEDDGEKSEEWLLSFSTPEEPRADSPGTPTALNLFSLQESVDRSESVQTSTPNVLGSKSRDRFAKSRACLTQIRNRFHEICTEATKNKNALKAELATSKDQAERLAAQLAVLMEAYQHLNEKLKEKSEEQQKRDEEQLLHREESRQDQELGRVLKEKEQLDSKAKAEMAKQEELTKENKALREGKERLMEEMQEQADLISLLKDSNVYKSLEKDSLLLESQELISKNNELKNEVASLSCRLEEHSCRDAAEFRRTQAQLNEKETELINCKEKLKKLREDFREADVLRRSVLTCKSKQIFVQAQQAQLKQMEKKVVELVQQQMGQVENSEDICPEEEMSSRDLVEDDEAASDLSLPPPSQDSSGRYSERSFVQLQRSDKNLSSVEGSEVCEDSQEGACGGGDDDDVNKCYRHSEFTISLDIQEVKAIMPEGGVGDLPAPWKRIFKRHLKDNGACSSLQFSWAKLNQDIERYSWLRGFAYCKEHNMGAYRFEVADPPNQDNTGLIVHVCGAARRSRKQPSNF